MQPAHNLVEGDDYDTGGHSRKEVAHGRVCGFVCVSVCMHVQKCKFQTSYCSFVQEHNSKTSDWLLLIFTNTI